MSDDRSDDSMESIADASGEDGSPGGADASSGDSVGFGAGSTPPLWTRLGVALLVAFVVAGAVGGLPALQSDPAPPADPVALNNTEYGTDELAVTEIPARGRIQPDVEGEGTVVIDDAHVNEYRREDVQPLVEAFTRAGYDVSFYSRSEPE